MSEEIKDQEVIEPENQPSEDEVVLPSDKDNEEPELTIEEWRQKYAELEEVNKKAEDIAKRLKDEKSQENRDKSNLEKEADITKAKEEFLNENLQTFIDEGMVANEDIATKAEELGITQEQLELSAYKLEKAQNAVYELAGGKDEYFAMTDVVKEHYDRPTQEAFMKAVVDPILAPIVMEGLRSKYNEITNGQPQDKRITVDNATQGGSSGVYSNEQEYFKDKRAASRLTGSARDAMMKKISAKLAKSSIGLNG